MAKYRRSKVSIDDEMNIAIGCIMSDKFTRDFVLLIGEDLDLLKSKYLRMIISWAIEYYKSYDKACEGSITDIFKANKKTIQNDDDLDLIEDTLENISEKYVEEGAKFDSDYIFHQVEQYIKGRSLEENADIVKGLVAQGKIGEAERIQKEYLRKEKSDSSGVNVFKDMEALKDVFTKKESLFEIPGALGKLIKDIVTTDFILLGGNSKMGKSYYSMQFAMYGVQGGLKVGYFSLEMEQVLCGGRVVQFVGGGSLNEMDQLEYLPSFDKNNNIVYKKETIKPLSYEKMARKYRLFNKQCEGGELHIFDTTTCGSTLDSIKTTIINEELYNGRKFDLIVIDQISLISGGKGKERRHQLGDISARIKREICETLHIPVIAPVQFSKGALKTSSGGQDTIAESYEIFHHSSILISLNSKGEEKEKGLMRITCSGRRHSYLGEIIALQSLSMGRPIMDTRFKRDIPNYNDVVLTDNFTDDDELDLEDI